MEKLNIDASDFNLSWFGELCVLIWRNIINYARVPAFGVTRIISAGVGALLVFVIYSGMDDSKQGAQDRMGAFAFIIMNAGFTSIQAGSVVFPMERPVFLREINNGMYRVSTYFTSKLLADAPLLVVQIGL